MMADDWIKTYLPETRRRLHEALLRSDQVPEKDASTPLATALYHLSRHSQALLSSGEDNEEMVAVIGPDRCTIHPRECRAYCLAQAILSCEGGAPAIAAKVIHNYSVATGAAATSLKKVVEKLTPATRSLIQLLGPQFRGLSSAADLASAEEAQLLLRETVVIRNELVGILKVMKKLGPSVSNLFLGDMVRTSSGKRQALNHLDGIVGPLLCCFEDTEIAALVPDGRGGDVKAAAGRMSNRRKTLVGKRKGGGFGKPGRPRKPQ